MFRPGWSAFGLLIAAACAAHAAVNTTGAVNFVEGQAAIDGKALVPGALEGVAVATGETLSTQRGRAEMLLTPGVFVRLGQQSAVKAISLAPADIQVELTGGEALIEVAQLGSGRLQVLDGQARVTMERPGIYEFHQTGPAVAVISGKARVLVGDRATEAGSGKLSAARLDALYEWSKDRSQADAQASSETAMALVGTGPDNWKGPGWYWDPFYADWGFLPGTYTLNGPFGETYYSAIFYGQYGPGNPHIHGYFTLAR